MSVTDRLIAADVFALVLIGLVLILGFSGKRLKVHGVYWMFLPLLGLFLLSAIFADKPDKAFTETVILLFSACVSIAIANLIYNLTEQDLKIFLKGYALLLGVLSAYFLLDYMVLNVAWGGLKGTFRNTGQAGTFLGTHAAICLALSMSGLVPKNWIYNICIGLLVLALILTVKRAALIGLISGVFFVMVFLLLSKSKTEKRIGVRILVITALTIFVGSILVQIAIELVPGLAWRFETKVNSDTVDDFASGFFAENVEGTLKALDENPFVGVGAGNVAGVYTAKYEIHSTYLGILATSGILGAVAYLMFVLRCFIMLLNGGRNRADDPYAKFIFYMLPMCMGMFISWGYTYHLRKRSFWFMVAMLTAIYAIKRRRAAEVVAAQYYEMEQEPRPVISAPA
ncbi:O-antigen ligase family protein [Amylibacter marinus]|uniref:O-antigen ligase family protein n=1 Tax=Amylibacter marinus TaxID=1475483 RepID=UPI0024E0CABD|nr:O-antigen ligase family protein [Amylibacter marinus]